ncbi:MAG: beta-L-arabinofuranosidase domain-containing protein [Bacteroidota bacterium]
MRLFILFPIACILTFSACNDLARDKPMIEVVDRPDLSGRSSLYPGNREPLLPNALIKLPVGSIQPKGWLLEFLNRQRDGLTGNLGQISAWLQKEDNAWLSKDGTGKWGWEEVPYWLKGYGDIAYILEDPDMIAETKVWIEGVLSSQRESGYFGPGFAWESYLSEDSRTEEKQKEMAKRIDFWPNMIMLYCLQSYYEYSGDERVIELMTNYFRFELAVPEEEFLHESKYWQRRRAGDNFYSVIWLYNRTGEAWLLDLAEKIHRHTVPWGTRGHALEEIRNPKHIREGMEWPEWYGDLIDWHNVNVAQGFREPAQYYQLSKNPDDLKAAYDNFHIVRQHFGQVPGGMFGADENARPGYNDPRQGIETCGMVEQMNSDEHLLRVTGDIYWADHAEEVAFNTYPAAVTPDFRSLRYITSPNMVLNNDENHSPGIDNSGPFLMMNPFSSRCCQHNHAQGWPYSAENQWMATQDNGLAAVLYSANTVRARVGSGKEIEIVATTRYPFNDQINFSIQMEGTEKFPLYLRIPAWAKDAELTLNNEPIKVEAEAKKYIKITSVWKDGDHLTLTLPRQLELKEWDKNHNSASINYGPLTFSLKIDEEYVQKASNKTAIRDSKWQEGADPEKWPSYEIFPKSAWNYGLVLGSDWMDRYEVIEKPWPENNFPFTPETAPIEIKAKGKRIPAWQIDEYGLAGELQDSPVSSEMAEEDITLIPMGAARLRISAFPVIGEEPSANKWK